MLHGMWGSKKKRGRRKVDVIIHIGAPKAGSSAIQKFCLENRSSLLREGLYYPKHRLDANGVSGGHSMLSTALSKGDIETAERDFYSLLSEARALDAILLLSSEGFYRFYERVAEMMQGLSVRVVGFFRDPLDAVFSNYNQTVKRHYSTLRFSEFCGRVAKSANENISGARLIRWADSFGDDNCRFELYSKNNSRELSIESRFLEAVGVSPSRFSKFSIDGRMVNRSYTLAALELKRLLNHVLNDENQEISSKVDWFLQRHSDCSEEPPVRAIELLDACSVRALCDAFSSSNHALKERFGWDDDSFGDYSDFLNGNVESIPVTPNSIVSPGGPLKRLCEENPQVVNQLREMVVEHMMDGQAPYSLLKLADLFNVPFDEGKHAPELMTKKRLQIFLREDVKKADFLRELSLMMESSGDLFAAGKLIDRARKFRPNGRGIQKIQHRIQKERKERKS
ncbi:hypothetical protein QC589_02270 [Halomonas elongata]|uniref:hypothetical protein n=1 Tax=Halomonas elongata TaxID=2746 RepID=UPI0033525DFE